MYWYCCYYCWKPLEIAIDGEIICAPFYEGQIVHPELCEDFDWFPVCHRCHKMHVQPELHRQEHANDIANQLELFGE